MSALLIRRLEASDLFAIQKREQTIGIEKNMCEMQAEWLASLPYSYAVFSYEEDRLIFVGGVIERWPGRAEAWAVFAPKSRHHLPSITEATKGVLSVVPYNRVEVAVRCDFPEGHAWASDLGFKAEAECLEAYDADGNDCSLYARVRVTKPRKVP